MSRKTPRNVEEISLSSKTSSFYRQNVEEMRTQKKMSRKTPENVEEISLSSKTSTFHPQNVEKMTTQKKMSRKTPENVEELSLTSKTSTFHPQNVEKMTARKKMSRKTPQNVEKPPLQKSPRPSRMGITALAIPRSKWCRRHRRHRGRVQSPSRLRPQHPGCAQQQ